MKRRALLVGILLSLIVLIWTLVPPSPEVPIEARSLYTANNSKGQLRYIIAVTNIGSRRITILGEGEKILTGTGDESRFPAFDHFYTLELPPHEGTVFAYGRADAPLGRIAIGYVERATLFKKFRQLIQIDRDGMREPKKLLVATPPESNLRHTN